MPAFVCAALEHVMLHGDNAIKLIKVPVSRDKDFISLVVVTLDKYKMKNTPMGVFHFVLESTISPIATNFQLTNHLGR